MRAELAGALALLTRLPVGRVFAGPPAGLADSIWAFPVAGALVGGIGGAVFAACAGIGLPPSLGAVSALAAQFIATGALHEDGLADTADGFCSAAPRERALEIMRDSRIGTFGALALLLTFALRATAVATIATPGHAVAALVAGGALGRGAILVVLLALVPARADGLAAALRARTPARAFAGLGLAALAALLALPLGAALWSMAAAALVALLAAAAARRRIGGYTGDVLGAAAVLAECAVLVLLCTARVGWAVTP